jgi:outer membrane lipoprotein LolB
MLNGCSSHQALFNYDHTINNIAAMHTWQVKGKLAIIATNHNLTTNFQWQQDKQNLMINFTNSIGFGTATLTNYNHYYQLVTSDGQTLTSDDLESLLVPKFGINLPINSLAYWLRGLADPQLKIDFQRKDAKNLVTNLTQQGWHIEYASYKAYNGIFLPCKIYLTTPKVRIKIFIINWYQ